MRVLHVLTVWRLRCFWVAGPERPPAPLYLAAIRSPAAVPGRPARTIWAWRDYEITGAAGRRAIER